MENLIVIYRPNADKVEPPTITIDDLVEVGDATSYERDLAHDVKMLLEDLPF